MLSYQRPMFSDDDERRPLLSEDDLRDTCLHAAATIVVAFALGCEFEDCRLDDDGRQWPVSISIVEIKYPESWRGPEAFASVAMIHEAGAMAVAKRHGRSPHRVRDTIEETLLDSALVLNASATTEASGAPNHLHNPTFMNATRTSRTATLLDVPLIWAAIEAMAQLIESDSCVESDNGLERCFGVLGTDDEDGDSPAFKLFKDMGLTPGWASSDGRIIRPKLQIVP